MAKTVTKDMIINDVLALDEGTAKFFIGIGMHCIGCPSARGETVEEACAVHGVEVEDLLRQLNDYLAGK